MSDRDQRTRERAYHLWEHAGRPHHRDHEFWAQAQAEIAKEESTVTKPGAKPSAKRTAQKPGTAAPPGEPVSVQAASTPAAKDKAGTKPKKRTADMEPAPDAKPGRKKAKK